VNDYTEEFHRIYIRSREVEEIKEALARYVNGLRYGIQDELTMAKFHSIGESYQLALKAEENLSRRKQGSREKGTRGRGKKTIGREQSDDKENENAHSHGTEQNCCRPNTHLQTWRSLQPTWCVLGGTNLNPDPLSPQSGLLPSRLTPREAKGGRPY
jgi:hypothetical protein